MRILTGEPHTPAGRSRVECILAEYLPTRRWFAGKSQTLTAVRLVEWFRLSAGIEALDLAVCRAEFDAGIPEDYVLLFVRIPARLIDGERPIAWFDTSGERWALCEATDRPRALTALLPSGDRIGDEPGVRRRFRWSCTKELEGLDELLPALTLSVDQSNSAVVFGERYFLKLYRKLLPGRSVEVEVGSFLAQQGTSCVPAVIGALELLTEDGEPKTLAILEPYVPNAVNLWDAACQRLSGRDSVAAQPGLAEFPRFLGELTELGALTAELHRALCGGPEAPLALRSAPLTRDDLARWSRRMREAAIAALSLLRTNRAKLSPSLQADVERLLDSRGELLDRFDVLPSTFAAMRKIRIHGDYHLGQVLLERVTGSAHRLWVIDFEGEPLRPLAERRELQLAVKDVAGMVRSLAYFAHVAAAREREGDGAAPAAVAELALAVSRRYIEDYWNSASHVPFLPDKRDVFVMQLDVFILEKAVYELSYELTNRPDWVAIPLSGVLALVS